MRFYYPYFLLLIPALAVFFYIFRKKIHPPEMGFSFSAKEPENNKVSGFDLYTGLNFIRLAGLVMLILAFSRLQSGEKTESVTKRGIDIMLVLDTSTSMRAVDFMPKNRLDVALEAAKEFVKARKNDRMGVVVFSAVAFTQCPLTSDYGTLLDFLDKVKIGMTQTDGTAIGSAIVTAANRLKDSTSKEKVMILLTDGRSNMGEIDPLTAARAASAFGIKIYAIGAGKPGKAVYPVDDPIFGRRYVQSAQENDLDEPTLMELANVSGGKYFRAQSESGLKEIYRRINELEKTEIKHEEYVDFNELFRFFLILAAIFLIIEQLLKVYVYKLVP